LENQGASRLPAPSKVLSNLPLPVHKLVRLSGLSCRFEAGLGLTFQEGIEKFGCDHAALVVPRPRTFGTQRESNLSSRNLPPNVNRYKTF
jgi:hypothetical protein